MKLTDHRISIAAGVNHTVEGVLQTGKVGAASLQAWGWASTLGRQWTLGGKKLEASGEYKFASGTHNPDDAARSGTFDTLYAANHDKFGHQDLLAWRNIHNLRALAKYALWESFSLNLMYNNSWLASTRDALYTNSGSPRTWQTRFQQSEVLGLADMGERARLPIRNGQPLHKW